MRSLFLLVFSLFSVINYGQSSTSLKINFLEEGNASSQENVSESRSLVEGNEEFEFIGISAFIKEENLSAQLFYRLKVQNNWGEWIPFTQNDHGFTPGRTTFEGSFIKTKFGSIQFKADKKYSGDFTFRFYFPSIKSQEPILKAGAQCSCPQPAFCTRSCWCPNNDCPKDATPSPTQPSHIIVHHSAGANTSNDFAAIVAYYWDLHVNTNGWDDIGYNWLIDPNGVIYEGRGDGVGGAHFSCMNGGTTGICLIGNFQNLAPKKAAIEQLKKLISWEACDKNISPNQSSYHPSSMLNLENISGHQDGNSSTVGCPKGTACPGNLLYARLDSIRMGVDSFACLQGVSFDQNLINETALALFPNPSSEKVSIEFHLLKSESCLLEVINPLGQVVRTWEIKDGNQSNLINLDLKDWKRGLYVVKLISGNREYSESLIVQ